MNKKTTELKNKPCGSTQNKTACPLCSRNCGLLVTEDAGQILKVKGDPEHPITKGYICNKAAKLEFYQNHQDRLTHPLKKKVDGSFEKISWDQALSEIAQRLGDIRDSHGADAFAVAGGGGQGNHLGGAYLHQLRYAMGGSRYVYSALAQEKTMDFWMNGRLFGDQRVHCTEDVENADYVLFMGCNPYQSHGIPNARDTLREIKNNPDRKMVVVDPRITETAKQADIHLQLKPGTDAQLLSALLGIIVQEGLHDRAFLKEHCTGFDELEKILLEVPVSDYLKQSNLSEELVRQVAFEFASAKSACVRIDLGLQHSLNSTLTAYLEKMLYIVTGNFGKVGGNNLHTLFLPLLGNTDERKREWKLTAHHKMMPISGLYPPNILPDEILHEGEDRLRAVWVDSCNPLMSYADSAAYRKAFESLELLVVVDVAMTETAELADYVLPASSQFEKWEATGFNAEFPENFFHLRPPLTKPKGESLPEPEIYTRLMVEMGVIPERFPWLERIARLEPDISSHQLFLSAFILALKKNPSWAAYAPSILYKTFGQYLPNEGAAAAIVLPLAIDYAKKHADAVKRAGIQGNPLTLGINLFKKIISSPSGTIISQHTFEEMWKFIRNKDGKIHLGVDRALNELRELAEAPQQNSEYPFILMAGERRAYNANQIYRTPQWRKTDKSGALRLHPSDAEELGAVDAEEVWCISSRGRIKVSVQLDDSVQKRVVTLPHGYGMSYQGEVVGPAINVLTDSQHCDEFTKTPYHKYVSVRLEKLAS